MSTSSFFSKCSSSLIPSNRCVLENHRLPTHRQFLHWPTGHRLTDRSSTDLPSHRPTDHRPLTYRLNWPQSLWLNKLILTESPLKQFFLHLISICHSDWVLFTSKFVNLFLKWLIKKNADELQVLLIIPFGNWYFRIGI